MDKHEQRLQRQIDQLGRTSTVIKRIIEFLTRDRLRLLRLPLGVLLILGGFVGFLPVLGFWMVPLGLLVLSYEFAMVRRHRRRFVVWWERRRRPD